VISRNFSGKEKQGLRIPERGEARKGQGFTRLKQGIVRFTRFSGKGRGKGWWVS